MKVAILTYGKEKPLGKFSKGYINDLPFERVVFFGGIVPFFVLGTPKWKQKLIRYSIAILALNNPNKIEDLKQRRLSYLLRKHKVTCGLAEFLNTGASVMPVFKANNIPLISNVLGYEINDQRFLKRFDKKYKALAKYQSYTVPVAKDMIPKLTSLGFVKDKIKYSPIGPASHFFEIEPNYESNNFVFIGRMTETKSPINLIKAFKIVNLQYPESRLKMAGDGELMNDVKDLIVKLNLQNAVTLEGWIDEKKQLELYQSSFCYVQHSKISSTGDKEGTPVSILEASASGLPIVSTFHAGIPDVILNQKTGLLIEENDIEGMAEMMLKLYVNRELAQEYGKSGRKFILENFSLKAHLKIISELILKTQS